MEYINDLIAELEMNEEHDRVAELKVIKDTVRNAVTKNAKKVKAELQLQYQNQLQNSSRVLRQKTSGRY